MLIFGVKIQIYRHCFSVLSKAIATPSNGQNCIYDTSKCPEKLALANLIAVKNRSKCELCNQRTFISKCSEMRRNSLQSNIDFSRTFVNGSGHVTLTSSPLLSLGYNF